MGSKKVKPDAGTGGRLGHSNMTHWFHTAEVKDSARRRRRDADETAIREGLEDVEREREDQRHPPGNKALLRPATSDEKHI